MFVNIQGFLINVKKINVIWIKENKILLDFDGSNLDFDDSCISLDYDEDFLKFISEIDYFVCGLDDYTEKIDDQEIYALNIDKVGCIDYKGLSDQRLKVFVKKICRREIVKEF